MLIKIKNQIINTDHVALIELKQENEKKILWIHLVTKEGTPNILWNDESVPAIWEFFAKQAQEILPSA